MEPHDLVIAKLCAGHDKDLEFVRALLEARMVRPDVLLERLALAHAPATVLEIARQRLVSYIGAGSERRT
jgi:hypothetical protein